MLFCEHDRTFLNKSETKLFDLITFGQRSPYMRTGWHYKVTQVLDGNIFCHKFAFRKHIAKTLLSE